MAHGSTTTPDLTALEPLLLPTPASLSLTGGRVILEPVQLQTPEFRTEPGRGNEWYRLEVASAAGQAPSSITVTSSAEAGRQHALHTLAQLRTQYHHKFPALIIEDQPALPTRGVMLDVSRDRVPTNAELRRVTDTLSHLKLNHVQLYTEHTFAYRGAEEVWQGWSPIAPDDVRTLDRHCRTINLQLAANQNCFGHLASWLRHPKYANLAETHGDWVFDVWPRSGPFSLCPTDRKSIDFIEDILSQLLPCFTTPLVNIGCDETYDIAYGRSKEEVARRGRATVYIEFVNKIAAVARRYGKQPMFWADIALSHPECVNDIPQDMISLAWGYEADSPFSRWCDLLCAAGRETWVCPGTSSWRSITGRTTERRANIDAAAAASPGATGMLICDWGDTGHHQQWPITLHALAYGAAKAWNTTVPVDLRALSLHVFNDRSLTVAKWLDDLGDVDLTLRETCGELSAKGRVRLPNQSALFIDMLKKLPEQTEVGRVQDWEDAKDRLATVACRKPLIHDPQLSDELEHTLNVAQFAATRGAARRHPGGLSERLRRDLIDQLEAIITEHRRLWLLRSREGGLDHSCGYYRQIEL